MQRQGSNPGSWACWDDILPTAPHSPYHFLQFCIFTLPHSIPPKPSHSPLPPHLSSGACNSHRPTENLIPLCLQEKKMLLSRDFQHLLLVERHHLLPASSGERRAGVRGTWSLHSHPRNLATKGRMAPELLSQHCLSGGLSLECPLLPPTKHPHGLFFSLEHWDDWGPGFSGPRPFSVWNRLSLRVALRMPLSPPRSSGRLSRGSPQAHNPVMLSVMNATDTQASFQKFQGLVWEKLIDKSLLRNC